MEEKVTDVDGVSSVLESLCVCVFVWQVMLDLDLKLF